MANKGYRIPSHIRNNGAGNKELRKSLNDANRKAWRFAAELANVYHKAYAQERKLQQTNEQLFRYAHDLSSVVYDLRRANDELEHAYLDTISRLVIAAEYRDKDTGDHINRISLYSAFLARCRGLDALEVRRVRHASPMHDIGKIGIPDHILLKPGTLTDDEFALIKTHPLIGSRILGGSAAQVLMMAEQIARCHHERWDGNGYPCGLRGTDIPISARIVNLADTFDALTSARPYKEALSLTDALEVIRSESGRQFDPELVDLFVRHRDGIERIHAGGGSEEMAR
jgi:putative two-component system response regulator